MRFRPLWLIFAAFIVYGTTIPFQFTADSAHAADKLSHALINPLKSPETGRRLSGPDAMQNILLFVPFGVLGVLAAGGANTARRIVVVTVLGFALSLSVEIFQLFTVDRISSTSDILTNTIGSAIGAFAAAPAHRIWRRGLRVVRKGQLTDDQAFYPVLVATIVTALAAWEPFDATLDVSSTFSKVRRFFIDPWQFTGLNDEGVTLLHAAVWTVALCAWFRRPAMAIVTAIAGLLALEASQIIIASRMPGLEDAAVRIAGVMAGWLVWLVVRRGQPKTGIVLVLVATAVGAAMQMLTPFQRTDIPNEVQWLPFMNYYAVTTFVQLSHAVELMLIYLPLGFVVGLSLQTTPSRAILIAFLLAVIVAVPIEYAQRWVIGRYPDVTDPSLGALGAWLGAWAATVGARRFADAVAAVPDGSTIAAK